MTLKEIQELIKLVAKTEIAEFKFKDEAVSLHIRGKSFSETPAGTPPIISVPSPVPPQSFAAPAYSAPPAAASTPPAPPPQKAPTEGSHQEQTNSANLVEIKSPMIGTFYRSPSPDKDAYVKVGDTVSKGDTVCIVEAMKLFNEIESEVSGKIVKVLVEDAQPIEYDMPLFLVDPS